MTIQFTISNFIEKHFPKIVTNWRGDVGNLLIKKNTENDKGYENWVCISYVDNDLMPIESRYDEGSNIYLASFYPTMEEAVIDMADRLISGNLIK